LLTRILSGAADELETAPLIGVAAAVKVTSPRLDGFHEQVAVKVEPDPRAVLFLQPGKTIPFNLNVTLADTVTIAEIVTGVLKLAVVAEDGNPKVLKDEVSTTSVTVIVIDWVPAFPEASVAVSVRS
jgi:hypothetical protein